MLAKRAEIGKLKKRISEKKRKKKEEKYINPRKLTRKSSRGLSCMRENDSIRETRERDERMIEGWGERETSGFSERERVRRISPTLRVREYRVL